MRVQFGIGLVIAVLLPLALLLFGILHPYGTLSSILLLAGLWILAFSLTYSSKGDRTYNFGLGLVIAILSTFYFIPLADTFGLELLAVIGMVVVSVVTKPKTSVNKVSA